MRPGITAILLIFIAWLNQLAAQVIDENNFTRYTKVQGLSHNYITGIVQDSMGYIWIGTYRGLNRFDGSTFKQLLHTNDPNSIPDNAVYNLEMLPGNELGISTTDGAQVMSANTLRSLTLNIPTDDALRYWSNAAYSIMKDRDGNIGVSTKTGFYVFSKNGKLKKRFDHYSVRDIGQSWMLFGKHIHSLPDGNILQENSQGFLVYDREQNLIENIPAAYKGLRNFRAFFLKNRIRFYFLSAHDLLVLNNEKNTIDIVDIRTGNTISYPSCIQIAEEFGWESKLRRINDTVWAINSHKNGFFLLKIDVTGRKISCDPKRYFPNDPCTIVFADRDNRLWVGTRTGLYMQNLHQKIVQSFSMPPQPAAGVITSLHIGKEKIYVGTSRTEVMVLDKKSKELIRRIAFPLATSITNVVTSFLTLHPDTMWVSTSSGLIWLNTRNYSFGKITIPGMLDENSGVRTLFRDSKKNVWLGVSGINKVVYLDSRTGQFRKLTDSAHPLLKVNSTACFAEDKNGNIWFGADAVARWNPHKEKVDTLIEHLSTQQNRKKGFAVMSDSRGDIWVLVNDDGVAKITGQGQAHVRTETLIPDYAARIAPSLFDGKIFLATHYNIGFIDINQRKSIVFNYTDGIPEQVATSRNFSYDSTDGSTWFACENIICRIPSSSYAIVAPPPSFRVSEVAVINDTLINYPPGSLTLKHYQNDINIALNAVNFTDPMNMRFAYRFRNKKDASWIETGSQQNILLTNISPGKYDMEVRLRAFDNKWPEQVASMQITILPPFWATTWFYILIAALLATLIFLFYRWRINTVRKTEREKLQVQELKSEEYKNRLELEQISNYFSSSLGAKKNTDEILWDVAKNLIGHMGYQDCMIYLWNSDKTKMIQHAGYGPKGTPEAIASQVFDVVPGQGVVGYVMKTKKPVLISDTRKDSRYRMDEMMRLSEICVPIIHNGELLGIIDSENHELNYYKERDLKILTTIATLLGDKIKQIESEQSLEVKQEELITINQQLAEAQLSALQTQMNPHFIFNALNSIKRMILDLDNAKASRYMSKFGLMIRLTLDHSKEIFVTLRETIEYLRAYIEMEQLRFDDSFSYCLHADEQIDEENTNIPSLVIQPLVENAIWHGLMHVEGKKELKIRFSQQAEKIICTIEDNGIGICESERLKQVNKSAHKSVGLDNLRNRIKIMNEKYNMECSLGITDLNKTANKRGTLVVLSFNVINK